MSITLIVFVIYMAILCPLTDTDVDRQHTFRHIDVYVKREMYFYIYFSTCRFLFNSIQMRFIKKGNLHRTQNILTAYS